MNAVLMYIYTGIGRGKDMSNITGIPDSGRPSPVLSKRKRKGRSLTNLDDSEADSDESEEYHATR